MTRRKSTKDRPDARSQVLLRLPKFAALSGYTETAVRRLIDDGAWELGRQYQKTPDGQVLVDLAEYERWVMAGPSDAAPVHDEPLTEKATVT